MRPSQRVRFESRPLPGRVDGALRSLLAEAHRRQPFSPLDARQSARRAAALIAEVGVETTLYRGGLDLRGVEADHVWLAAIADGGTFVVDAAFPLFSEAFLEELRRFVCGDASREELAAAAEGSELDDRVLGVFPPPVTYLGSPVWSAR